MAQFSHKTLKITWALFKLAFWHFFVFTCGNSRICIVITWQDFDRARSLKQWIGKHYFHMIAYFNSIEGVPCLKHWNILAVSSVFELIKQVANDKSGNVVLLILLNLANLAS